MIGRFRGGMFAQDRTSIKQESYVRSIVLSKPSIRSQMPLEWESEHWKKLLSFWISNKILKKPQNYGAPVKVLSLGSEQRLALGRSQIPFLQHDHANRALIGANILRQAVSTVKSSSTRVSSGIDLVPSGVHQNLYSRWPGLVTAVSAHYVVIFSEIPLHSLLHYQTIRTSAMEDGDKNYQSIQTLPVYFLSSTKCVPKVQYFLIMYAFRNNFYTNQSTLSMIRLCVEKGRWVHRGDLLADRSASIFGQIAVGQNLLLGSIAYDGLNHEDGVVASQALAANETFSSVHIEQWDIDLIEQPDIRVPVPKRSILKREKGNQHKHRFLGIRNLSLHKYWPIIGRLWHGTKKNMIKKTLKVTEFPNQSRTERYRYSALDRIGVIKVGTWVEPGQSLIFKRHIRSPRTAIEFLLIGTKDERPCQIHDVSLRAPVTATGRVLDVVKHEHRASKVCKEKQKLRGMRWVFHEIYVGKPRPLRYELKTTIY
jgi:DNA-directed RNA polymerase beta subunit